MKPILPYSILFSIAISPLALADYNNGSLRNYNDTLSGIVDVTGDYAVYVDDPDVNTILQGKVTLTATGIYESALFLKTYSMGISSINVNTVNSDVNITTLGSGDGSGIAHAGDGSDNGSDNGSKITIDAGRNWDLNVKKSDAATAIGWGVGVDAVNGGNISITAKNVNVDFSSTGESYGVYSSYSNSIINITAEKVTAKAGRFGVLAENGGVINITGNLDAATTRTDGIGVRAYGGGYTAAVTVDGHTSVSGQAQYGVLAAWQATVTLKKGLTVDQTDLGATVAVYAYGGTVKDGIAHGADGTTYKISGQMRAETDFSGNGGTIDLHMGEHSVFAGYTTKDDASIINLELSNGAQWTNTVLSTTSSLSLLANSIISFNEIGTSDTFYSINSTSLMLAEGSILKVDLDDLFTGDITLFGDIANTDTWNGTVDAGNATLLNAAGTMQFIYTNPSAGVFRITGSVLVPEPTTASLTLLGLTALMMRRRRLTA